MKHEVMKIMKSLSEVVEVMGQPAILIKWAIYHYLPPTPGHWWYSMHKTFYMYAYVDHAVADPSIREAAFPHGSSSEAQKKTNSPSSSIQKLERHAVEAQSMERRHRVRRRSFNGLRAINPSKRARLTRRGGQSECCLRLLYCL